jgi:transposase
MAVRSQVSDSQWQRIQTILECERGRGRPALNDRRFIEGVLWWRRTGVPWRDLPTEFGPWKTVFNRFDRWSKNGKWARIFEAVRVGADNEWHSIDSTTNRAHQHAAGGKGGPKSTASDDRAVARRPRFTLS